MNRERRKSLMGLQLSLAMIICSWLPLAGCVQSQNQNAAHQEAAATAQDKSPLASSNTTEIKETRAPLTEAQGKGAFDACALLAPDEIRAVQGEAPKESKPSTHVESAFAVSQCFYSLPTYNNSISLEVTRSSPGAQGQSVRQFWNERFHDTSENEKDGEKEREREKERGKDKKEERESELENQGPLKINGVGDEAFWSGSAISGALYVLKGKSYIRLSTGGNNDVSAKINKLKTLAQYALKRLK
jgi:hypothetical protein